jgi:two-component system nitrogen regulation sensor histidine kinase NtrY
MSLRAKFILFALIMHAAFVILALFLYTDNVILFFVAEAVILISIAVTFHFYRAFTRPLDVITAGIESIQDQDFSTKFTPVSGGEIGRLVDTYNKMIDQLRNERVKRQEQHYFLERLICAAPIGIIILDLDQSIVTINPAGAMLLSDGRTDLVGRSLRDFQATAWGELADLALGETKTISINGLRSFRCSKFHFLDRGFPRHFILIEELSREIMAAQKRAYDKVIRMMSHEINNSVGAVNSILDTARNYKRQLASEDQADFENALQVAIDRNQRLNRFMANFADVVRIPSPVREPYDLHRLLKSVQVLMGPECERRGIAWRWELAPEPLVVNIDVQQMEQVLVNIIKNAIEAIDGDGAITVQTSSTTPRTLRVIDTGTGITPEQRPQLFAPFFSTKRAGQGIGLTLIREILVNHGFSFNLESTGNGRTEFWIEFR